MTYTLSQAADELEALQAEVFALTSEVANKAEYAASMYRMHEDTKLERDVALARLAITEEANSMLLARNKWLEHTLEVAGASPVKPSQALELELSDAEIKEISSDLILYEDYQPESCQADYLDPVKFARAIIAAINAKERAAHGIKQGGQQ